MKTSALVQYYGEEMYYYSTFLFFINRAKVEL